MYSIADFDFTYVCIILVGTVTDVTVVTERVDKSLENATFL